MKTLLNGLADSPGILEDLLREIPYERLDRSFKSSWTIMEHLDHLLDVQDVFTRRIELFRDQIEPVITAFQPEENSSETSPPSDTSKLIKSYRDSRLKQIDLIRSLPLEVHERRGRHSEQSVPLSFERMLIHFLSHDHFHIYRIEELGTFRDDLISPW